MIFCLYGITSVKFAVYSALHYKKASLMTQWVPPFLNQWFIDATFIESLSSDWRQG